MDYSQYIKNVPDFPVEGIQFKDITPLIGNGEAFQACINEFADFSKEKKANKIVGPDARGFIVGAPVSYALGLPFIPIRKPGKLPRDTYSYDYDLEYGSNSLSMHKDAISKGDRIIIMDDLLATGGTLEATIKLVEQAGGEVVGLGFIIELEALKGRHRVGKYPIKVLLKY
ncbi:MAG TPA: adenine phosphoribosyltransferase [Candidatus Izemoplasmatales bacterium]|nr:adenine phosphoribosyltransferase [Candidatus Izemoplasmatales bacterium]